MIEGIEASEKNKRTCLICGKDFTNNYISKFCSDECRSLNTRIKMRVRNNIQEVENICIVCNSKFKTYNKRQKICSKECRKEHEILYFSGGKGGYKYKDYLKLRFEIFKRDNFTCQYCGRNVTEDKVKLVIDHQIPKNKQGKDDFDNLITSCEECNLGKSDILLYERGIRKNGLGK